MRITVEKLLGYFPERAEKVVVKKGTGGTFVSLQGYDPIFYYNIFVEGFVTNKGNITFYIRSNIESEDWVYLGHIPYNDFIMDIVHNDDVELDGFYEEDRFRVLL